MEEVVSNTMREDTRNAFDQAAQHGRPPPGDVHGRGIKRRSLILSNKARAIRRGKEVKHLLETHSTEVLFSRGDIDFPEFDGGDF